MKKVLTGLLFFPFTLSAQIITTIAGGGSSGLGDGGQATACELNNPESVVKDAIGNLYIADRENNRIRKVNPSGVVTTIAGTGATGYGGDGGPATLATLDGPFAIAVSISGDIYFTETDNGCVRKIDPSGVISTVAGTGIDGFNGDGIQATTAQLNGPGGIAIDNTGNIFIADGANHRIRKINSSGIITTIAGTGINGYTGDDGQATNAKLNMPNGIALDGVGNLYVTEYENNCVRKVDASGIITTIAGGLFGYTGDGGPATSARLKHPIGIAVNALGYIYVADVSNHCIREIDPSGTIHTVAGNGTPGFSGDSGNAALAKMSSPTGVYIDNTNNVYIADWGNDRIRSYRSFVSVIETGAIVSSVKIYPNPTNGAFTLQVPSIMQEVAKVVVCDAFGRQVTELVAPTNSPTPVELSVPPGIYFLSATTGDAVLNTKILISH